MIELYARSDVDGIDQVVQNITKYLYQQCTGKIISEYDFKNDKAFLKLREWVRYYIPGGWSSYSAPFVYTAGIDGEEDGSDDAIIRRRSLNIPGMYMIQNIVSPVNNVSIYDVVSELRTRFQDIVDWRIDLIPDWYFEEWVDESWTVHSTGADGKYVEDPRGLI